MSRVRVARNFAIQVTSRILAIFVGLISVGILTRSLGTTGFGEYTTALTFLHFFAVIVDFGLTLTIVVMISENEADHEKIIGNIFGLRMISGAVVFAMVPLIALFIPWSTNVKQAIFVGTVAYVLMGGANLLVGVFQRYQSMWRAGLAEILNRIALLIFIALFAYFDLGVAWMVGATLIANAVWLYATVRLARPFVHIKLLMDFGMWRHVWSRSWPIAISIFFNLLYLKGDILFLSFYRSQAEVGIYGVTYRVVDMLTALPVMFMGILLPLIVNTWSSGNREEFSMHVRRTFDLFMLAAIPIVAGTYVISDRLMLFLAGPGYEASGAILRLLIFAVFGVFLGALYGHLVVALNKQKLMVWGYLLVAVLTLIGYFIFIPTYGMWGAAWMTIASEGLISILTFFVVYRVAKIVPNIHVSLKALLASGVMFFFLKFFPSIHVLIDILLATFVYLVMMIAIKGIKLEDIYALREARKSLN